MSTSPYFWTKIAETPWWIYLLFSYLVFLSYLRTKPSIVSFTQLFIYPGFSLVLSFVCLYFATTFSWSHFYFWLLACTAGTLSGWLQFQLMGLRAIQQEKKLYVRGSFSLFLFLLFILLLKFYYGFKLQLDPKILLQPEYSGLFVKLHGFFSGLFLGRFFYSWKLLHFGPFYQNKNN